MRTHDESLSEVFAELIRGVGGAPVTQALELLTRRSVDLLGVSSAGILVADFRGAYRILASSDEQGDFAEFFQALEREGPAVEVVGSGRALTVDLNLADGRWPSFTPAARGAGIAWVHALPISLDSMTVGALILFRLNTGGGVPDHALSEVLCGLVSIALAQERPARRAERLTERIQQILNDRGRIEQVKGIIAAHMGVPPAQAYSVLIHHARAHDVLIVQVAGDVIGGRTDPLAMIAAWRENAE
ncbi:GAF and ANTAR domain-containing protein [Actinomadura sp. DC4]|uniref:GAF and ANTAR domain-containing protein n=1 Tax=Actinomadura sp. DC4 TaxID=3055069 RepID=UPI0025B0937D|nr:GAF and ANTAR domain-containing protein [Actinomadura sp. DC4]MDN3357830.1 GAF and ANTAR domain-containing protein [Actinomadura sp. DC4]